MNISNHYSEVILVRYFHDDEVREHLQFPDAITLVRQAFADLDNAEAVNQVRLRSQSDSVILNVMWALAPKLDLMGIKSYPVISKTTTRGTELNLLLYSMSTGEIIGLMKADILGQIRTGAATAVATKLLARADSEILTIFGTGFQAEGQLRAVLSEMPNIRSIRVVARNQEKLKAFASEMQTALDREVLASEAEAAVRESDIVITATSSVEPVLFGDWLREGTHVNAVGSNVSTKREVDLRTLERAGVIVADDATVALTEAGDFIANEWPQDSVISIGSILNQKVPGRTENGQITLFSSQGLALQDIYCADHILRTMGVIN
ncbi:MAG: ornithine cyclodeaminase family protein [Microbacteriaceae bacterium]